MSRSVYIASPEGLSGKSSVALGLVDLLSRRVGRVGVFRPIIDTVGARRSGRRAAGRASRRRAGLRRRGRRQLPRPARRSGRRAVPDRRPVRRADRRSYDAVVVVGSDYTDVTTGNEWATNAQIAANLGSPVVLVVHGRGRTPRRSPSHVELACSELVAGTPIRSPPSPTGSIPDDVRGGPGPAGQNRPGGRRASRKSRCWCAPTVADLQQACGRRTGARATPNGCSGSRWAS